MDSGYRPCTTCGAPMGYVPQYASWYCSRCQRYATAPPWPQQPMGQGPWPSAYAPPDAATTRAALEALSRHQPSEESSVAPGLAYGFLGAQIAFLGALYLALMFVLVDGQELQLENSMPFIGAVLGIWLILGLIQAVLVFRLVNARDAHFRRDRALRETLLQHISSMNAEKGGVAGMEVATLGYINSSARIEDNGDRGALLWAVLAFVPVVNMLTVPVVLYGLTRDLASHDPRQAFFCHYSGLALARTGKGPDFGWQPRAQRSAGLYLLLAFVTGGLFLFYWYYTLLDDMAGHFASQRRFEESLAISLQG